MSVALVIPPEQDATRLVSWARWFAQARPHRQLIVIWISRRDATTSRKTFVVGDDGVPSSLAQALDSESDQLRPDGQESTDSNDPRVAVQIVSLPRQNWAAGVLAELETAKVSQLLVPRDSASRKHEPDEQQWRQLVNDAHCELIQIRARASLPLESPPKMLVAAGPDFAAQGAIEQAIRLAAVVDGDLTAVYVEPNVDDFATHVGTRILERHLLRQPMEDSPVQVKRRVVLGENIAASLTSIADDYDLLLLGVRRHGLVRRLIHQAVSDDVMRRDGGPTIISIRPPTPLGSRVVRAIDNLLRNHVPQLARDRRVALVERIQASSMWDFDFITLIFLSTLIATCGLLQNSSPVVIGAMLVAPLMTPLLGAGLSLVQGNPVLLRNALLSVVRGFMLALVLALAIGLVARWQHGAGPLDDLVTHEIAARGNPHFLDLTIALVSGIAAAYATGRPNLLSALPGVAIASALVPPIGCLGLGIAWQQWQLALGAGLLFMTNIVAIVLGTAFSFWAVGIRAASRRGFFESSTWRAMAGLVIVLLGLAIIESLPSRRVPDEMVARVTRLLEGESTIQLSSIYWENPDSQKVVIHVNAAQPITSDKGRQIANLINDSVSRPVDVEIKTTLVNHFAGN